MLLDAQQHFLSPGFELFPFLSAVARLFFQLCSSLKRVGVSPLLPVIKTQKCINVKQAGGAAVPHRRRRMRRRPQRSRAACSTELITAAQARLSLSPSLSVPLMFYFSHIKPLAQFVQRPIGKSPSSPNGHFRTDEGHLCGCPSRV